jgi:hypothetical protein
MDDQQVYQKVAAAVNALTEKLDISATIMPIGVDGAITYHLLDYALRKKQVPHEDYLNNTVQASSRSGEMDDVRLCGVLIRGASKGKPIYGLDLRTQSGGLGKMLHAAANDLKQDVPSIDFKYVTLFDPRNQADIRASQEELTDTEKKLLRWFDSPEEIPVKFKNESWQYYVRHDKLARVRHVPEIKSLI